MIFGEQVTEAELVKMRCGEGLCTGRRIPMRRLDTIIMGALVEPILELSRLRELLASCLEQSSAADAPRLASLKALRTEKSTAEVTLGGSTALQRPSMLSSTR